jgi:hypothetical protein
MPLKLRPTGLGHGVYKDDIDYSVFSGVWLIGRIYERKDFPDAVRFFWSLHGVVLTRARHPHLRSRAVPRNGEGAVQVELGALAGVVGAGTGRMTRIEQHGAVAFGKR